MADAGPAHGVVVLAAGASGRLGRAKQLLRVGGEALVRRAAWMALATRPSAAVVVVGAQADAVFAEVDDLPLRRIDCADWQSGMGASLRAGIAALPYECVGALIVLCDQPALDAGHLQQLCTLWRRDPERAAASAYAGRVGVPAVLPSAWFAALAQDRGDRGARDLLMRRRTEVATVGNEALARDIDHDADLRAVDR